MRKYEVMLILPPDADDAVVDSVSNRVTQTLSARGGEVVKVDRWGRRRLAYPIDRHNEGFYLVAELQAEPDAVKELDRVLALLDEVIRFKVLVRPAA